jgi:hypothetical protein
MLTTKCRQCVRILTMGCVNNTLAQCICTVNNPPSSLKVAAPCPLPFYYRPSLADLRVSCICMSHGSLLHIHLRSRLTARVPHLSVLLVAALHLKPCSLLISPLYFILLYFILMYHSRIHRYRYTDISSSNNKYVKFEVFVTKAKHNDDKSIILISGKYFKFL